MREIPLTQGKFALVDDDDYEKLSRHKWNVTKSRNTFYAGRTDRTTGRKLNIKMHREILGLTQYDGKLSDHKNRNGLDNRKNNLRIATFSLNNYNRKKNKNNTSGYRGVRWYPRNKKWCAFIRINCEKKYLGIFRNIVDAAKAYDTSAIQYWGENAILNFPKEEYEKRSISS